MPLDTVETAQLQRDIVSAVTHDLGSIAGALALRAEIPGSGDPAAQERQRAVLKSLADQVRAAMRMLEVIRGGEGRSGLGAARAAPEGWWIDQLRRLILTALPRGSSGEVTASDAVAPLNECDVGGLTLLLLGALHHLAPQRQAGSVAFEITVRPAAKSGSDADEQAVQVTLTIGAGHHADGRGPKVGARRTRWQRYCEALCADRAWSMTWWQAQSPDRLIWQCRLSPSTGG